MKCWEIVAIPRVDSGEVISANRQGSGCVDGYAILRYKTVAITTPLSTKFTLPVGIATSWSNRRNSGSESQKLAEWNWTHEEVNVVAVAA